MKEFSKRDKLKSFIAPNMKDIVTFLYNNVKLAVYTVVNIYGIYWYPEIIGSPTTFTTSGQRSRDFGP